MKYETPKLEQLKTNDAVNCDMGGSVLNPPARCNNGGSGR